MNDATRSYELAPKHVEPEAVLDDVRDFVALARSGSYMGGDRRVSPRRPSTRPAGAMQMLQNSRGSRRRIYPSNERLASPHGILFCSSACSIPRPNTDSIGWSHPALAGPELAYLQAKLAHRRGDSDCARGLMHKCLEKLPGHREFLRFAQEIGATLPARARKVLSGTEG